MELYLFCINRTRLIETDGKIFLSDGVNEVKASMQLLVRLVTDDMLFNSVTVRLADMTEEAFLSPLLGYFVEGLAAIIPCPKDNVYIFSVQVSLIKQLEIFGKVGIVREI